MTVVNGYEQSDAEKKLDILNLPSLEGESKKIIPTGGLPRIPRRLTTHRLFPRRCRTLILQTCRPTFWALI